MKLYYVAIISSCFRMPMYFVNNDPWSSLLTINSPVFGNREVTDGTVHTLEDLRANGSRKRRERSMSLSERSAKPLAKSSWST